MSLLRLVEAVGHLIARSKRSLSSLRMPQKRLLRVEALEDRRLLSVSAAEYADIRATYSEFGLQETYPENYVHELTSLTAAELQSLINSSTSDGHHLIVVRTTDADHTIQFSTSGDRILCDHANRPNASLSIVGYGTKALTIDGNQLGQVMNVQGACSFNLGNITITNGNTTQQTIGDGTGGGIFISKATTILKNCSITNNNATGNGGGLADNGAPLTLINTIVSNNTAGSGAGLYLSSTSATINQCTISSNIANVSTGGGIHISGTSSDTLTINRSIIQNNSAVTSGAAINVVGVLNPYGACNISNSLISGISVTATPARVLGAVSLGCNTNTITNCTITGTTGTAYYGLCINTSGTTDIKNSIILLNGSGDIFNYNGSGTINGYNTLTSFSDWSSSSANPTYVATDPLFVDIATNNYQLAENSQAIDIGNNDYKVGDYDLAGNNRINGDIIDLGAYEYYAVVPPPVIDYIVNTVDDIIDAEDEYTSLREAINAAQAGAVITFDSSLQDLTITLNYALGELVINKSITIDASSLYNSATQTPGITVAHNLSSGQYARLFNISGSSMSAPVILKGLKLVNGNLNVSEENYGSCILATSSLTIEQSVITQTAKGSLGSRRGIVYFNGANETINISDCKFTANKATPLYVEAGTSVITNTVFSDNLGGAGGAIFFEYNTIGSISGCQFTNNYGLLYGGAIYCDSGDSFVYGGNLTIWNSTFTGNRTTNHGGAIMCNGTIFIANSLIANNTVTSNATSSRGALYISTMTSDSTIVNCTIVDNNASDCAGLYFSSSNNVLGLNVKNSIILGNNSISGAEIGHYRGKIYGFNNLVSDNSVWENSTETTNMIFDSSKELFADTDNGDYQLVLNAQAVDTGNNYYISGYETDLAEKARIIGNIVDRGAYEWLTNRLVVDTIEDDTTIDTTDNRTTLREAIASANEGETITFATVLKGQTITLANTQLVINKGITIDASALYDSATQSPGITIDAQRQSRIFVIGPSEVCNVSLKGLQFINGYIYNPNVGQSDSAYSGGAIVNAKANLSIENSVFINNESGSLGGAIFCVSGSGTLNVVNSVISANVALRGGGIYAGGIGMITIDNTSFLNNQTALDAFTYDGGALWVGGGTGLAVTHSIFKENQSTRYGGAIYLISTSVNLRDSLIQENTSVQLGGGIYYTNSNASVTSTISNCTIVANILTGNTESAGVGGGYYQNSGTMTIQNSIILENTVNKEHSNYSEFYDNIVTIGTLNTNHLLSYKVNGISYSEYDTSKQLFANKANKDYRIIEGSQAYKAGDTNCLEEGETDLAGNSRTTTVAGATTVDLGAWEGTVPVIIPTNLVVNTLEDNLTDNKLSLREAIAYAGTNGLGNTITFHYSMRGKTYLLNGRQLTIDKALTIDATNLFNTSSNIPGFTIDAGGLSRVIQFTVTGDENVPLDAITLKGLRITGGLSSFGAGIYASADTTHTKILSSLSIEQCLMDNNNVYIPDGATNAIGGALWISQTASEVTLTISKTTITNNYSQFYGGGLGYFGKCDVTISDSIISNNSAERRGGGIFSNIYSNMTITGSTISDNTVLNPLASPTDGQDDGGAGIYLRMGPNVKVENSKLTGNKVVSNSAGSGGALYNGSIYLLCLDNCIITENEAVAGGGLFSMSAATQTFQLLNSTIGANKAQNGAGVLLVYGISTITSCRFIENIAESQGGGLYTNTSSLTMDTCYFYGNQANYGAGGEMNGSGSIKNSLFEKNVATTGAGAMQFPAGCNFTISNCKILENEAKIGGGLSVAGTVTIVNTLLAKNKTTAVESAGFAGGAVMVGYSGSATFINATIADNTTLIENGGAGIFAATKTSTPAAVATVNLYNTILVDNLSAGAACDYYSSTSGSLTGKNCLTTLAADSDYWNTETSENNLQYSGANLFLNKNKGLYFLVSEAQAIDCGNNDLLNTTTYPVDLADKGRIYNYTSTSNAMVDIGAYEKQADVTVTAANGFMTAVANAQTNGYDAVINFDFTGSMTITLSAEIKIASYIVLNGTDKAGITISGGNATRLFNIQSKTAGSYLNPVEMIGLTLTEGNGTTNTVGENSGYGGAIMSRGFLRLVDCNLTKNNANAAFSESGSTGEFIRTGSEGNYVYALRDDFDIDTETYTDLTITVSYTINSTSKGGGAIANLGTLFIEGGSITNNMAGGGGAIYNQGNVSIVDTDITGNIALRNGGAIQNVIVSATKLTPWRQFTAKLETKAEVNISNNIAAGYGGAIMNTGSMTLADINLNSNETRYNGGALCNTANADWIDLRQSILSITDCCIGKENNSNKAQYGGGILNTSQLWLYGTSICHNIALKNGGGLSNSNNSSMNTYAHGKVVVQKSDTNAMSYINNNTASNGYGGGILNGHYTVFTIISNQLNYTNNSANTGENYYNCGEWNEDPLASPLPMNQGLDTKVIYTFSCQEGSALIMPGDSLIYHYDLDGDGVYEYQSNNILNVTELGLESGTHLLTIMLETKAGIQSAPITVEVIIDAVLPLVTTEATGLLGGSILSLNLTAVSSSGTPMAQWTIHWGDGHSETIERVSNTLSINHYYSENGVYNITLDLVDRNGFGRDNTYYLTGHLVTAFEDVVQESVVPAAELEVAEYGIELMGRNMILSDLLWDTEYDKDDSDDIITVPTNEFMAEPAVVREIYSRWTDEEITEKESVDFDWLITDSNSNQKNRKLSMNPDLNNTKVQISSYLN